MTNITFRQFEDMNKTEFHDLIVDTYREGLFLVPYLGKRRVGVFLFAQKMGNITFRVPRKEFIKKLPSFIEPGPYEEYQLSGSNIIFRKFAYKVGEAKEDKKFKNKSSILWDFNLAINDSYAEIRRVCSILDSAFEKAEIDISPYMEVNSNNGSLFISIEVGSAYYEFNKNSYLDSGIFYNLDAITENCKFITEMTNSIKHIIDSEKREGEETKEQKRKALLASLSREDLELLGLPVPDDDDDDEDEEDEEDEEFR